ncbi:MAG: DEAD/DEAH box helicase [Chloroflexi bacterium]|nr:DEAD/DEAH box helicase [Chloroflexota bacterium]
MTFSPSAFLEKLRRQRWYKGQIVHVEEIPARPAEYGTLDRPLHPQVQRALEHMGITRFYTHQAQAINAARAGHNVIVTTGTASGKTLAYNIPVLESLAEDWRARALYLYPTKALAQDQLRSLRALTEREFPNLVFGVYDGDTPTRVRARLRKEAQIILTNPDMLHVGILPHHTLWASFFRGLKYVVIDEAHTYRGIFGSQVALVLRRLWRLCAHYGSQPRVIAASATIANPQEHFHLLTGAHAQVVDRDGSPRGPRTFVLWNPPVIEPATQVRRSPNSEATRLITALMLERVRTIAFARARRIVELILKYVRHALEREAPELRDRVAAYRAGYRAEDRRAIERALFEGKLLAVIATTALELGIDIGDMDASVLVGFPGTIASMWQQAGRAGRRGNAPSLSALIAYDNPMEQYFMRHPEELFGRPIENALINPDNEYLLRMHLPCAARELPLVVDPPPGVRALDDERLFGPNFPKVMRELEESGILRYRGGRWYYMGRDYPAKRVSLRSIDSDRFLIVDEESGQVLEEIEASTAAYRAHPGAVYLHMGETYVITRWDEERRRAYARRQRVDYYTQAMEIDHIRVQEPEKEREIARVRVYYGKVRAWSQVVGFRVKQLFTEEVLAVEDLDMPPTVFDTRGLWWVMPPEWEEEFREKGYDFAGSLHAAEHACIAMLPLFTMSDRWDIGGVSTIRHPDTDTPVIAIYDGFPGGAGITEKGFESVEELWRATLQLIETCPCENGCPSCIQSPKCGNNNQPLDKHGAIFLLRRLVEGGG